MLTGFQVNGGSQSFNTVNTLRVLGRWMRMFTIPNQASAGHRPLTTAPLIPHSNGNQASLPLAWKSFTPSGRLLPSSNRDRLVDVCEELVKTAAIILPHFDLFGDRYSERTEKAAKGRLYTQAEKEKEKDELLRTSTDNRSHFS